MKVIGTKGCGSVIAEAALILAGISYLREEIDYEHPTPELLALNPLGQVPTIVMDDGSIMTETAAFAIWLDGEHPRAKLLPPTGDPLRAQSRKQSRNKGVGPHFCTTRRRLVELPRHRCVRQVSGIVGDGQGRT
jgi:glutathione S-transferase